MSPQSDGQTPLLRVVIIDSNESYRNILANHLREQGFLVIEYANPDDAIEWLMKDRGADALLIDDDRPGRIGVGFAANLRNLGIRTPVALVTSSFDQQREELALSLGASDYFSRQRSLSIIASRLSLLANGAKLSPLGVDIGEILEVDWLQLQIGCQRAYWRNERVPLTVTEFRIVCSLAIHAGDFVNYRDLYDLVHGAGFSAGEGPNGFRCNVRSLIRRIRAKFHSFDETFDRIENEPGLGYKWGIIESALLPDLEVAGALANS